ncbi:MAG: DUF433 domain-containing protein [Bacteroidetes bacterium]|nr:DUF433 domain-containing protein [Bacteroidota bacterium]
MIDVKMHIESNPNIMLGKPVIKGTRITVELILTKLADGYTPAEIIQMFPHLKLEDIFAAITYAASVIANEEVIKAA